MIYVPHPRCDNDIYEAVGRAAREWAPKLVTLRITSLRTPFTLDSRFFSRLGLRADAAVNIELDPLPSNNKSSRQKLDRSKLYLSLAPVLLAHAPVCVVHTQMSAYRITPATLRSLSHQELAAAERYRESLDK